MDLENECMYSALRGTGPQKACSPSYSRPCYLAVRLRPVLRWPSIIQRTSRNRHGQYEGTRRPTFTQLCDSVSHMPWVVSMPPLGLASLLSANFHVEDEV